MNWQRWLLLLGWIPIVIGAQICLRYEEVRIQDITRSDDGRVSAVVDFYPTNGSELWTWSSDLSKKTRLFSSRIKHRSRLLKGLAPNCTGDLLVFQANEQIIAMNPRDGSIVWRSHLGLVVGTNTDCIFINDDQHILVLSGDDYAKSWFGYPIRVLDAKTGKKILHEKHGYDALLQSRNRLAFSARTGRGHRWKAFELDGQRVRPISISEATPIATMGNTTLDIFIREIAPIAPSSPLAPLKTRSLGPVLGYASTNMRPAILRTRDNAGIHERRLGLLGKGEAYLILLLISALTCIWTAVLVNHGYRAKEPRVKILFGAALLTLLILVFVKTDKVAATLMGANHATSNYTRSNAIQFFPNHAFVFLGAATISTVFLGLLHHANKPLIWVAVVFACMLPILAPSILLAIVWPHLRAKKKVLADTGPPDQASLTGASANSQSSNRWYRFTISEMMMITAAFATFIAFGQLTLMFIWVGLPIAAILFFALLLSLNEATRTIAFFATLFLLIGSGAGSRLDEGPHSLFFALTTVASVCFYALMTREVINAVTANGTESALG